MPRVWTVRLLERRHRARGLRAGARPAGVRASTRARGPTFPYAVASRDKQPLAFAALASWWRVPTEPMDSVTPPRPSLHERDGAQWLLTATILTCEASPDFAWQHSREPIV